MTPKLLALRLSVEGREVLTQLLAKTHLSDESDVVAQLEPHIEKTYYDMAAGPGSSSGIWNKADGYGNSASMPGPLDPMVAPPESSLFTSEGIIYAGGKTDGWHCNRKIVAVGGGGAMTDASKRRCEEGFEFVEDFEVILSEKETLDAIAEFNRGAIGPHRVPMRHHGSPHQYPVRKRSCLNATVPLPADASDSVWYDILSCRP